MAICTYQLFSFNKTLIALSVKPVRTIVKVTLHLKFYLSSISLCSADQYSETDSEDQSCFVLCSFSESKHQPGTVRENALRILEVWQDFYMGTVLFME